MPTYQGFRVKTLFLKITDLPANDVRQIEVFLRFAGRTPQFQWTATAGSLIDLKLVSLDPDAGAPAPTGSDDAAALAWILDRGQKAPDSDSFILRRPLQMDGFEALLRTRELEIARDLAAMKARTPARVGPVPAEFADDGRTTYRLVKWPSAEVLRGNPGFVRILSFLSTRALTLKRLITLSGVDETTCRELMELLDRRRLLVRAEHLDASASVADILGTQRAAADTARGSESANAGLFSRLRKRLGLG